jgi:riboflavin synthase
MFTGLVEALGRVESAGRAGAGARLTLRAPEDWSPEVRAGDSIAVSGVCLTAVSVGPGRLDFDLAEETLAGDPVNLERPLRLGAPVGGHLVLGHVDGVGRIVAVEAEGAGRRLTVVVPPALRPYLIPKGSVAVDGVSLTVAALDDTSFAATLIPHTLAVTTLGVRRAGARVNLEMDVLGKYVRAFLPAGDAEEARAFLGDHGLLGSTGRSGGGVMP